MRVVLTSAVMPSRRQPVSGEVRPHRGDDYAVPQGTPIRAAAAGRVVVAQRDNRSAGGWVVIQHGPSLRTEYMHLSRVDVREGQDVSARQPIGLSGGLRGTPGAGLSAGAHLHFAILVASSVGWTPVPSADRLDWAGAGVSLFNRSGQRIG